MRRLAPADLSVAARALLVLPEADRARVAARMVREAEAADRYRKRTGRVHPFWGSGTLEGAARAWTLAPMPSLSDQNYLSCLGEVLVALMARKRVDNRTT